LPRESGFRHEYVEQVRKICAQFGATDTDLANFFDVSVRTINYWKMKFPEFGDAVAAGKEVSDSRVVQALYHRAIGYSHDETVVGWSDGAPKEHTITKHYPPDVKACLAWVYNRVEGWHPSPERKGEEQNITINIVRPEPEADQGG
jgi:hypothetical protein